MGYKSGLYQNSIYPKITPSFILIKKKKNSYERLLLQTLGFLLHIIVLKEKRFKQLLQNMKFNCN